ncbi:MAG: hypothetical protein ACMVO3_15270 [Thalassobaculum sp.]
MSVSTISPWRGRPARFRGGESQRIRLASQIGSGLTGVLYVLDEPSIGLHQRDNDRLLDDAASVCATSATPSSWSSMTRTRSATADYRGRHGSRRGRPWRRGRRRRNAGGDHGQSGKHDRQIPRPGFEQIEIPAKRRKASKGKQLKVIGRDRATT